MVLKASSHSNISIILEGRHRVLNGGIRLSKGGIMPSDDGFIRLSCITWVLLNRSILNPQRFKQMLEFITSKILDKNVTAPFLTPVKPSPHPIAWPKTPGYYAARRLTAQRRALRPPGVAPDPSSSPRSVGHTGRIHLIDSCAGCTISLFLCAAFYLEFYRLLNIGLLRCLSK